MPQPIILWILEILMIVLAIPFLLVKVVVYLILYLYEAATDCLWPESYYYLYDEDVSLVDDDDENKPWIERWTAKYDSPIYNEDDQEPD